MQTQIVYGAHTPAYIWDALKARATETRIHLDVRCPACGGEIRETGSDFHCEACEAPVSFFQHRFLSDDADTRVIYIQVNGNEKEIYRLDLCCLSCEAGLDAEELCPNTCEIQTFLTIETDSEKCYVKRWVVRYLYKYPRPTTEIPIRETLEHRPITDISQESDTINTLTQNATSRFEHRQPTVSSPSPRPVEPQNDRTSTEKEPTPTNKKKNIEGQILALLPQDATPMRAAEIKKRIHGNHKNTYEAIKRLTEKGHIVKPKRGWYALSD